MHMNHQSPILHTILMKQYFQISIEDIAQQIKDLEQTLRTEIGRRDDKIQTLEEKIEKLNAKIDQVKSSGRNLQSI